MSEWMPIETVTRDCEVILYYPAEPVHPHRFCMPARIVIGLAPVKQRSAFGGQSPTHWMPLPAPPLPDANGGRE